MTKTIIIAWRIKTIRAENDLPSSPFIGDKDHEKVFNIVRKVETRFKRDKSYRGRSASRVPYAGRDRTRGARCHYCQQPGRFQA
jgi:hypothetical protein